MENHKVVNWEISQEQDEKGKVREGWKPRWRFYKINEAFRFLEKIRQQSKEFGSKATYEIKEIFSGLWRYRP